MNVPLWIWLTTFAGIFLLIAFDVWHARRPGVVGFREAATWSVLYVLISVLFGIGVGVFAGAGPATEFFAGYLVEKSLSIDNLFVFAVLLAQFSVPPRHQKRVLLIGIVGALIMRGLFIAVGAAAVERFAVTFVFFGLFLLYTAVKLARSHGDTADLSESKVVRLVRKVVPVTEDAPDGALSTRRNGRWAVTPLMVVVIAILFADLLFALDSIPAVFGVTDSAYLVLTANVFAVLGLRALYFLLVGMLDRLVHLHYGLAIVLGFIGVKLVLHYLHTVLPSVPEIPTLLSLGVVIGVLAVTTLSSLRASRRAEAESAAAEED